MKTPAALLSFVCALFVLSSLPSEGATYLVDRHTDANPAGGGQGSNLVGDLRFAITEAQSGDSVAVNITGTINLAGALPALTRNISIHGPGANLLTVHGAGGSVLSVSSGATVVLSGLTISGGVGNGGGIFNGGTLTLNNDIVSGNTAGDPNNGEGTGAGIWNYVDATLTLNNCTVSGNSAIGNLFYAPSAGGGIANYGTLVLNNSTVSGNSAAQGFGGGISNRLPTSMLTLNNSTVSGNSAFGGGGGLDNRGTLIARNTIIAGNTDSDLSGNLTSQGHNLFGTTSGSGVGATDLLNVSALLGPLQDNGGLTPTMAPLPGSPAINLIPGTPGLDFLATDQRGIPRPQGTLADSGAVEVEVPGAAPISPETGVWWNPAESGRGFYIEANSAGTIFFGSYLYEPTGRAAWYSSALKSNAGSFAGTLDSHHGGQTLAGAYAAPSTTIGAGGNVTLTFTDPWNGTINWAGGTTPIQRFRFADTSNPPPFQPQSGAWWNPAESGRGFALEINGSTVVLGGYMYDAAGDPIWYLSTGTLTGQSYQGDWAEYASGQSLGGPYVAPTLINNAVGQVSITFSSPTDGVMTLPNGTSIPITRFLF